MVIKKTYEDNTWSKLEKGDRWDFQLDNECTIEVVE